ncbi:MAG: Lon protease-like protein [Candidatus Azotimanducaceae bacterium]
MIDQSETVVEAALFPIPNLVAFPGTVIPLHVFEPRYRQLVKDCLEDGRMIGVCHTRKTIRDAPKNQTAAEMLSSNQATYQPQEVFSAGPCKLIDTTPDGRLLAEIHIEQRLIIKAERQTLPYRIVTCELMSDEPNLTPDDNARLREEITAILHPMIAKQDREIADSILNPDWDPTEFSFGVFQYLRLEPDLMQQVLETRSTFERLTLIWEIVEQGERS